MQSLVIAFAMYSKIPMPRVDWNEKNMKYALCFFPWIGGVIALLQAGWMWCADYFQVENLLRGSVAFFIPILITGGIHMDGYLDTIDAIHSYGDQQKRLEILKDSNSGAFAIIYGLVYLALSLGIWSELNRAQMPQLALVYCISRTLSGLSVELFPKAKKTGLAATFQEQSDRKRVSIILGIYVLLEAAILVWCGWQIAGIICAASVILFAIHHQMCMKMFGGITGDLAGFFLQVYELVMAAVILGVQYI